MKTYLLHSTCKHWSQGVGHIDFNTYQHHRDAHMQHIKSSIGHQTLSSNSRLVIQVEEGVWTERPRRPIPDVWFTRLSDIPSYCKLVLITQISATFNLPSQRPQGTDWTYFELEYWARRGWSPGLVKYKVCTSVEREAIRMLCALKRPASRFWSIRDISQLPKAQHIIYWRS